MIYCLFPCSTVSRLACPESLISRLYTLHLTPYTLHLTLYTKKSPFGAIFEVFKRVSREELVDGLLGTSANHYQTIDQQITQLRSQVEHTCSPRLDHRIKRSTT